MKILTESQILKLRPSFIFGSTTMIDWFEIHRGAGYYIIRSGLNHADGETKSPFYYSSMMNEKQKSLRAFTEWWTKNKL